MARKQDPAKTYEQHDAAFRDVSAWVVVKNGERVATIAIKTGGRSGPNGLTVTAFVHVFGGPMVKGIARGGGYDMKTAAILEACNKLDLSDYIYSADELAQHKLKSQPLEFLACRDYANHFKGLMDSGHDVMWQLRDMGFSTFEAV